MLACLQRRQNPVPHRNPEAPPTAARKREGSMPVLSPRYPSSAELDAYAQKTANSPLSIKIFPANVRVPQHKHLNRTVNGFDTTGQRYSPYAPAHPQPRPGAYQGLLAIVRVTSAASSSSSSSSARAVVKSAEGRRTKLSPALVAAAPYPPPCPPAHCHAQGGFAATAPPPNVTLAGSAVPLGGVRGLNLPAQSHLPSIQSIIYQINQHCQAQALQQVAAAPTNAHPSPCKQGAAVMGLSSGSSGGSYVASLATHAQGSLGYAGTVLPGQNGDLAKGGAYIEGVDYILWQKQQQQQQQQQQAVLRMYSGGSGGGGAISKSPESCIPGGGAVMVGGAQLSSSSRAYPMTASVSGGGGPDKVSSSPLNCLGMQGNFTVGQYFAPPWNSVLVTPDSDCYNPQELPATTAPAGPATGHRELGFLPHPHHQLHNFHHHHNHRAPGDSNGCCSLPSKGLCNASALSSSLQSLEYLINDIHPPCIKERMLGKGYETVSVPRLLDHQHAHIRLPVYR
ncbi:protein FAM222A [Electrophorus electricus]|uniref:protein FAM222A n=1 Tax=Electrophorus electricus TaxID=8005 RepID=UPI0015CFFD5C|nr:protein FAM222A [Electrophorus electricus]